MRMILFFDLPSVSKRDHREYDKFIKILKKNGFIRMQESVFTKLAVNQSAVNSCMLHLKKSLPPEGIISILTITETQFSSIEHLIGEVKTDMINTQDNVIKL